MLIGKVSGVIHGNNMVHNSKVQNFDRGKPSDNDPIDGHHLDGGETLVGCFSFREFSASFKSKN